MKFREYHVHLPKLLSLKIYFLDKFSKNEHSNGKNIYPTEISEL